MSMSSLFLCKNNDITQTFTACSGHFAFGQIAVDSMLHPFQGERKNGEREREREREKEEKNKPTQCIICIIYI